MSWEGKVYVTASNPAPGQDRPIEGDPNHTISDKGLGINTYIAGGTGPEGTVPVVVYAAGTGEPTRYDPNGFLTYVQPTRLVGGNHEGTVMDEIRWTSSSVSGGAVLYEGKGFATITPGTTTSGSAFLMTSNAARYLTPFPNFVIIVGRLSDAGVDGNLRRWGASDDAVLNYLGFELSGTQFNLIAQKSGGLLHEVPVTGAFDLVSQVHRYEIHWWRERARWYIDGHLVHEYFPSGSDATMLSTVVLRPRVRSTNWAPIPAGSGNIELHEGSITRAGPKNAQSYWYQQSAGANGSRLLKKGPGTFYRVTFNGLSTANNNAVVSFYDASRVEDAVNVNMIASIDTSKITFPITLTYDLDVSRGIWVIAGSSAAGFTTVFD